MYIHTPPKMKSLGDETSIGIYHTSVGGLVRMRTKLSPPCKTFFEYQVDQQVHYGKGQLVSQVNLRIRILR